MDTTPCIQQVRVTRYLVILLCCFGFGLAHAGSEAAASWWAKAAQGYSGTSIRGITEDTPASQYVVDVLAPAFERETGIKVVLEWLPWQEMYDNSVRDMALGSGVYDFVFVEQDIVYAYLAQKYLTNLSKLLEQRPKLKSPHFSFADFTSYLDYFRETGTGGIFGIPIESFLKVYIYRKDLFDDPVIRSAFQDEYGYPLKPASTLQAFRDISAFFTAWGKRNEVALWGTTIQAALAHPGAFYELVETVLPSFGVYDWGIDRKTRQATLANGGGLDSPKAKQGLEFWLELLQFAPPEAYGSTWHEVELTVLSGRVAHGWIYGEYIVPLATDPGRSAIAGKVGTALPPLAPGVLEDAKQGKGYVGYYDGGAFGIPHSSRHKDATLLWLQYVGQPSVQADWALATGRVTHKTTFDDPRIRALDSRVGGYFTLVQQYGHLFAGAPPFPEHAAIREVITPFIDQVIRRELAPSDALDLAAAAVDSLLKELH